MTRYISNIVYGVAILPGLLFFNQGIRAQEASGEADTLILTDTLIASDVYSVPDSFSMEGELVKVIDSVEV